MRATLATTPWDGPAAAAPAACALPAAAVCWGPHMPATSIRAQAGSSSRQAEGSRTNFDTQPRRPAAALQRVQQRPGVCLLAPPACRRSVPLEHQHGAVQPRSLHSLLAVRQRRRACKWVGGSAEGSVGSGQEGRRHAATWFELGRAGQDAGAGTGWVRRGMGCCCGNVRRRHDCGSTTATPAQRQQHRWQQPRQQQRRLQQHTSNTSSSQRTRPRLRQGEGPSARRLLAVGKAQVVHSSHGGGAREAPLHAPPIRQPHRWGGGGAAGGWEGGCGTN